VMMSQADYDAAIATATTSDNTDVMMSQADYDAAIATAATSDNGPLEAQIADLQDQLDALQNPDPATDGLETTRDNFFGTTANDAFTATAATLGGTDAISDASTTDSDTLTVTLANGENATAPLSITGIENVIYNVTSFSDSTIDIDNIIGADVTVNNLQLAGATGATVNNMSGTTNVVAGTGVTGTFTVEMNSGATGSINAGSATALTVDANAAADTLTVVANGDLTLTHDAVTTVAISATAASSVTLTTTDAALAATTITGDANTTLVLGSDSGATMDISDLSTDTVSGFAVVSAAAGTADVTGISSAMLINDNGTAVLTIADGATIEMDTIGGSIDVVSDDDSDATTNNESSVTITLSADTSGAADYDIELIDSATDASDEVTTLNIVAEGDLAGATGAVAIDTTDNALDTTVVITGAGDVDAAFTTTSGGDVTLNAAAMTGALTTTSSAELISITSGDGDDDITVDNGPAGGTTVNTGDGDDRVKVDAGETATVEGGDGSDTIAMDGAADGVTFSGFEILETEGAAITAMDASQLSGLQIVVDSTDGGITIDNTNLATVDLSGLNVNTAGNGVTINTDTGRDTTLFTASQAFNVTGTNANDTITGYDNDDIIDGGAGADSITGGTGADTMTGGTGDTNFIIASGDSTEADMDIITDYDGAAAASDNDTLTIDTSASAGGAADAITIVDDIAADTVNLGGVDADGGLAAADVTAVVTSGMLTLDGDAADVAVIDTLEEMIDAAEAVLAAFETDTAGAYASDNAGDTDDDDIEYAIAFEFGAHTYVVTAIDGDGDTAGSGVTTDDVIQLSDVTGMTLGTAAAADTILIA